MRRWCKGGGGGGVYVWSIPCAGAQRLRKGRSAGLRSRAACGYAGAERGTARGCRTGPRRRAARGCVGPRRGTVMQRRMRLHGGRSVGSRWGAVRGCAGEPRGAGLEGGSLAHRRCSGRRDRSRCCGCALPGAHGGDLPACPRTARERARRGAARFPWGLHSTAGAALACGAGEGAAGGGPRAGTALIRSVGSRRGDVWGAAVAWHS